jgi:3-polyprenyl-4-hydroxybenzoate decarboxylase
MYPKLGGYMTKINFSREYPIIPPILIDGNDPARFQLVMGNKMITGATYKIVFDFIFSNGQKLNKKMTIDF